MSGIKYLNGGLGLVASTHRDIGNGRQYDKYFSAPSRNDKYLTYSGTSENTIDFMADIIKSTLDDTKLIAPVLKGADLNRTLSNIFSFVFGNIQYKPDDPQNEELRRPKRAWGDRFTGVDCDCYSILIGSILSNLRIPFALRMVKINGKSHFQHVYVVIPKNGQRSSLENRANYYVVDPVLDTYNEEHPFTEKYDLFMQPIKYLNGVPNPSLNGLNGTPIKRGLHYSEEAARIKDDNVLFFDGIDYYERANIQVSGLNGLQGLDGLGFLSKIWGAVKTAGKVIKKIGGKAIKKVVFKKDGTKRGVFKLLSKKTDGATDGSAPEMVAPTPISAQTAFAQQASYNQPYVQQAAATPSQNMSTSDMINVAQATGQGTSINDVLNIVKTVMPDNSTVSNLINSATPKANSYLENRMISQDVAKAQTATITDSVLDKVYKFSNWNNNGNGSQQAGFGLNIPTILGTVLIAGAIGYAIKANRSQTSIAA